MIVEDIVLIQSGGIKVHVSSGNIGKALIQQSLNNSDKLRNTAGCRLHNIRTLNVQLFAIRKESIRIKLGNLHDGFIFPLCALEHLIFTGIRIGCQMSHIGDIHNPQDIISLIAQGLLQHILHDIGAQIANVSKMVHSRSTGVHLHNIRRIGLK